MKNRTKQFHFNRILVLVAVGLLYASTAFSAVPQIINYQGTLSDNGGNPINATLNITFTLYDADVAGNNLWSETQSVDVSNGVFNVQFGAVAGNPLSPAIFDNPLFLGIQVDADAEMAPRQALTSVGYAFRAHSVENDTLSSLSCSSGEIPKWNGAAWACSPDQDSGGDITGVTAGIGLTGGGSSGDVNISADTSVLQSRVSGSCPAGQSIRAIDANGAVTCEVDTDTDTDTTYSAGSGLALNGTTFSIPTNGVNASHLVSNSVGSLEIAPNAVGFPELGDRAKGVGVNGSIVIHASAFQPVSELQNFLISPVGYLAPSVANSILCVQAPVALPFGVTVTHFEISVLDNSTTRDIGPFRLRRVNFANPGTSLILGEVESSGASGVGRMFADNTIDNAIVNSTIYNYFVHGCFSDTTLPSQNRFYGVRIQYN